MRWGRLGTSGASLSALASLALFSRGIDMIIATTHDEGSAEIADWGYHTVSRFRATLRQDASPPMTLVLRRHRMRWQVIEMQPTEAGWRELGPNLGEP